MARTILTETALMIQGIFVKGTLSQMHTPLPAETPFDQSFRGRIDIPDVGILREGLQRQHYLRTFVRHIP